MIINWKSWWFKLMNMGQWSEKEQREIFLQFHLLILYVFALHTQVIDIINIPCIRWHCCPGYLVKMKQGNSFCMKRFDGLTHILSPSMFLTFWTSDIVILAPMILIYPASCCLLPLFLCCELWILPWPYFRLYNAMSEYHIQLSCCQDAVSWSSPCERTLMVWLVVPGQ